MNAELLKRSSILGRQTLRLKVYHAGASVDLAEVVTKISECLSVPLIAADIERVH